MALVLTQPPKEPKKIIRSLQGEVTGRIPFWLMRQAGRYLPEYRATRQQAGSFLHLCFNPELAAEVTLQPIRRFGMDAAIIFSDILVVPHALGQTLDFVEGEGPKLNALHGAQDISKLNFDAFDQKLSPVYEALKLVRAALEPEKTLIGFAGAPWTLACYMLQGYGDGEFATAKKFSYSDPFNFDRLIDILTEATTRYVLKQIESGANVIQLFDSWAGLLPHHYFKKWVTNPTQKIVEQIRLKHPDIPVIGFPRGAGVLYTSYVAKTGVQGIGIDTQTSLQWAVREFGNDVCLQGNLDPVLLVTGGKELEGEIDRLLNLVKGQPFIFNLGHGILKETPPEHVAHLAGLLQAFKR